MGFLKLSGESQVAEGLEQRVVVCEGSGDVDGVGSCAPHETVGFYFV